MSNLDGSKSGINLSGRSQIKAKYVIAGHDNSVTISETKSVAGRAILDDEDIAGKTEALKTAVTTGRGAANGPEIDDGLTAVLDELGGDAPIESRIVDRLDLLAKAAGAAPTILTAAEALKSAIQGWSWPS
jgi:hypothetical protein